MNPKTKFSFLTVFLCFLFIAPAVHALEITSSTSAAQLAAALTAGGGTGINITSAALSFNSSNGAVSSGTYANASGTYGIGPGVVISSGNVNDYGDGANTQSNNSTDYNLGATAAQDILLDPITGGEDHYDVTQLDIFFDMETGYDTVFFNVAWGSEEYPEWIGSEFIDAFGLYVNGTNIAQVGGFPVNVDHPNMMGIVGTELDGLLAPNGNAVNLFSSTVGDGATGNQLTFIIADSGDGILDSTAFISALSGTPPNPVPEPATMLLLGIGLVGLAGIGRKKFFKK